ncbi:MAG: hypothetical protein MI864_04530 [Pseudomonadales bacterium]|nr:hypothetical protein [Pseudomonadales bacterium]
MTLKHRYIVLLLGLISGLCAIGIHTWSHVSDVESQAVRSTLPYAETPSYTSEKQSALVKKEELKRNGVHKSFDLKSLPHSLINTQVTGSLEQDSNGHLILNQSVRHVFDYFFTARGEETQAQIALRITHYIKDRLSEPAQSEALMLLDKYIDYHDRLMAYKNNLPEEQPYFPWDNHQGLSTVEELLALRQTVRDNVFTTTETEALFGEDIAYDDLSLAILKVSSDPNLNNDQKRQRISALEQTIPLQQYEQRQKSFSAMNLKHVEKSLRSSNASEEEIYQKRVDLVGSAAADRLALIDERKKQWEKKRLQYLAEKAIIESHSGMTDADKKAAINHLMRNTMGLSQADIKRMEALDHIARIKQNS